MKMLDLRLVGFCKLFIEHQHYFGLVADKMTMQGFDSLSDDLII
jgi:hypothetical protein